MRLVVRHAGRFVTDLWLHAARSGRWWVPVVIVMIMVATVVAATAKVVVPTAMYTLF
ncbi:DUF5989 family protein [Aquihabitans sp. McL0605]|uniref:DUF5989 family protein n=1 Tax=Aquihabitans sp. McL0605 TaxID=3415671 RepID=UPI003CFB3C62